MKALVQREWRLLRTPLLLALAAQFLSMFVRASSRGYEQLLSSDPPVFGIVFAAWVGYHRFAREQVRGTWLLQPFSRGRLVQAKLLVASSCLLALALVGVASDYAWVATSPAPGGPIRSFAPYAWESLSTHLASTHAVMFGAAIAVLSPHRSAARATWGIGTAWVVFFGLDEILFEYPVPGLDFYPREWLPECQGLALATVVVLGLLTLLQTARDVGHGVAPGTRILGALWSTPVGAMMLLIVGLVPLVLPEPDVFENAILLRDGEVVVAHFDDSGGTAVRRDGRAVWLPRRRSDGPSERARLFARAGTPRFGHRFQFNGRNAFVAQDGRSLSFYQERGELDADTSCWGARGIQHGTLHCAPGPQIIGLEPVVSGSGLLVVTTESVHLLDASGDHLRWQAPAVQSAAWIRDNEGLEQDLAVFTEDELVITGPVERHFPPASLDARVYLLEDDTVAVLDHQVLTTFRETGTTTVAWPTTQTVTWPDDNHFSSLFLRASFLPVSQSTWWLAALFRLLGAAAVIALMRRQGMVHALIGLVLGPAYLLTVIGLGMDWDRVAIWSKRFRLNRAAAGASE